MTQLRYALNHMTAPALSLADFFALASRLRIAAVEIRNDLDGNAILDGTPAAEVRRLAEAMGIEIISINALQRFNAWDATRAEDAAALIDYARASGAGALVLVPVNDGSGQVEGERQANLRTALSGLRPMLETAGILGLVEPLGFDICSLKSKREAAEAIAQVGGDAFRLVHDTFHHHLAGEAELFADLTGLVHISGVSDPAVPVEEMRDGHRVLVDAADRLDNIGQIRALLSAGYGGRFSLEPFAPSVHAEPDPAAAIGASMAFIDRSI
jgi:2-keto-myo-inositol isomerase